MVTWDKSDDILRATQILEEKRAREKKIREENQKYAKMTFKEKLQLPENRKLLERFKKNQKEAFSYTIKNRFPKYKLDEEELFQEFLFEYFETEKGVKSIIDFFEKRGEKMLFDNETYPKLNQQYLNNEITKEEYWEKINFAEDTKNGKI